MRIRIPGRKGYNATKAQDNFWLTAPDDDNGIAPAALWWFRIERIGGLSPTIVLFQDGLHASLPF